MRPGFSDEVTRVLIRGWDPDAQPVVALWDGGKKAIDLVRRGSALPSGRFPEKRMPADMPAIRQALFDDSRLPTPDFDVRELATLMALDARERELRGDLDGAWQDVRAVLNMARQLGDGADIAPLMAACEVEEQGLRMGLVWAASTRQTSPQLLAAIQQLRSSPERLPLAEAIRSAAQFYELTLALPVEDLRTLLARVTNPRGEMGHAAFGLFSWALLNPAERERARRASRLYFSSAIAHAEADRSQQAGVPYAGDFYPVEVVANGRRRVVSAAEVEFAFESTPLLRFGGAPITRSMLSVDRNVTDRRALMLMLAIRAWQLAHDGRSPERLEQLVPSELAELPTDPFSGQPFHYIRSTEQKVPALGARPRNVRTDPEIAVIQTTAGQWLLYSVGPDGRDNQAELLRPWVVRSRETAYGDIVYPVPDSPAAAASPSTPTRP